MKFTFIFAIVHAARTLRCEKQINAAEMKKVQRKKEQITREARELAARHQLF